MTFHLTPTEAQTLKRLIRTCRADQVQHLKNFLAFLTDPDVSDEEKREDLRIAGRS